MANDMLPDVIRQFIERFQAARAAGAGKPLYPTDYMSPGDEAKAFGPGDPMSNTEAGDAIGGIVEALMGGMRPPGLPPGSARGPIAQSSRAMDLAGAGTPSRAAGPMELMDEYMGRAPWPEAGPHQEFDVVPTAEPEAAMPIGRTRLDPITKLLQGFEGNVTTPPSFMTPGQKFKQGFEMGPGGTPAGVEVEIVDVDPGSVKHTRSMDTEPPDAELPVEASFGEGEETPEYFEKLAGDTKESGQYTVKRGDTLWAIAKRVYGDPMMYKYIAQANGIRDPNKIVAGKTLTIPDVPTPRRRGTGQEEADEEVIGNGVIEE